jgi:large subunit ribosomal protein L18
VITQVITAHLKGDRTITTATTTQLVRDYDWKAGTRNLPAAYLTGLLVGLKAQQKNITRVNLDIGFQSVVYGNRLFSTLKGVVDSGLQIPHNEIVFPSDERLRGEHIANYSEYIKTQQENGEENHTIQFANYKKRGLLPEDVPKHFAQTKEKILQLQK